MQGPRKIFAAPALIECGGRKAENGRPSQPERQMSTAPRSAPLAGLAAVLALAGAGFAADAPPSTPISAARLSDHVRVLSSDAFEGREPGSRAEPKVIDYVVRQMKAIGLKPAGEKGGWTQTVPLAKFELTGPIRLSMTYAGQVHALTQTNEIVVATERPVDHVAIKDAPLVFVGYGVTAPERGWDDFKGVDLKGKVAVMLVNDPDFEAKAGEPVAGRFGGKAMTYYGRWTYKFEEAARRGALAALVVHETAPASYGWATVKSSNSVPQFDIRREHAERVHPLSQGWIQRDLAVALFKASGLDFEAEKVRARSAGFRPVTLKARFSADYALKHSEIISHNILGKVEGGAHPDQTVFYTAHWDHLGIGPPDARGDRIYNGAIDNADGVAAILEIARQFAAAPRPKRAVVFMATTAEEKNLLGAEYYAAHPLYPLAKTVADINIDALRDSGPARDVTVSGDPKGELQDDYAALAVQQGRRFSPDLEPEAGHFYRADHFPLSKAGVPAISIESGMDLYAGGLAEGRKRAKAWVAQRYHQPADQWSPGMDFRGMAIDAGLAWRLGAGLANSDRWPEWKPGSEFKATRDATRAQRR
jgi:Zn-dependent M28 family amino/carboxypeptidase